MPMLTMPVRARFIIDSLWTTAREQATPLCGGNLLPHVLARENAATHESAFCAEIWEWAMTSPPSSGTLVAILPCNDLDASERFYIRLGFVRRVESGDPDYRILSNSAGGHLHLTRAEKGWLVPGRNAFGLYLYLEDVDGLAAALQDFRSRRR